MRKDDRFLESFRSTRLAFFNGAASPLDTVMKGLAEFGQHKKIILQRTKTRLDSHESSIVEAKANHSKTKSLTMGSNYKIPPIGKPFRTITEKEELAELRPKNSNEWSIRNHSRMAPKYSVVRREVVPFRVLKMRMAHDRKKEYTVDLLSTRTKRQFKIHTARLKEDSRHKHESFGGWDVEDYQGGVIDTDW